MSAIQASPDATPGWAKVLRPALVLAAAALPGVVFRLWAWTPEPALDGYDERLYLRFGHSFAESGLAGLHQLFRDYVTDEVVRQGPPPTRLFAAAVGLLRPWNLAHVSFACGLGTVVVGGLLALRWLRRLPAAALATLLLGFSPLAIGLGQRGLVDGPFAFAVALSVLLFEVAQERPGPGVLVGLSGALLLGFLIREAFLLVLPAFALVTWIRWREGARPTRWLLLPFLNAPLCALGLVVMAAGGVAPLIDVARTYLATGPTIEYANQYQRGPWFRYLVDLLLVSPLPLLLALGTIAALALGQPAARSARPAALYLVAGVGVFSVLSLMNVRFILFADVFLRIAAAAGLVLLARASGGGARRIAAACAVGFFTAVSDPLQYLRLFVHGRIYDPVTAVLVSTNGLGP